MIGVKFVVLLCLAVLASAFPSESNIGSSEITEKGIDICKLPPTSLVGFSCYALYEMWTFNSKSGRCESYIYGGCGRTANLFNTEESCRAACDPQSNEGREDHLVETKHESCLLPVTAGPCTEFNVRYTFNQEKNVCESFIFGGCNGNDNNFLTPNECYETCGGGVPKIGDICEKTVCPASHKYYMDKGCLPQYKPNSCCPFSFDCPDEETDSFLCRYRGLAFKIGQPVTQMMEDDHCKVDCVCREDLQNNRTQIECSQIECSPLPQELSDPIRKPEHNCSDVSDCPQETTSEDSCFVNGSRYEIGQTIPTLNPCKSCICVDGFTDEYGPGCRDIHCVYDPPRRDCVPVFDTDLCCPVRYECANDEDESQNAVTINQFKKEDDGDQLRNLKPRLDICLQPKLEGPCRASVPSYFYNADSEDCEPFDYGGCHGNDNRFRSVSECRARCTNSVRDDTPTPPPPEQFEIPRICKLPPKVGPCRAFKPRFYFNEAAGQCQRFNFGGCRGNANKFKTIEACQQQCMKETIKPPSLDEDIKTDEPSVDPQCTFGNSTLNLGDRLQLEDACLSCVCSTPPEVTCTIQKCPELEVSPDMTCTEEYVPGQCCPTYSCLRNPPPPLTTNYCQENPCDEKTEVCDVQLRESTDGNRLPPIGVCVPASSVIFFSDDDLY